MLVDFRNPEHVKRVRVKKEGSRTSEDDKRMMYWSAFESMKDIEVSRVFMTPEMAAQLLEQSAFKNRRINQKNLKKLKRDIVGGRYQVTHQGVAMTREKAIIDGQHRMAACRDTGICIPIFMFSNLLEEMVWSVDRGCLRTVDQDLYMHDYKWATERVALLRMCVELLGHDSTNIRDKREFDAWMPLFEKGIDFVLPLKSRVKGTAKTAPVLGGFAFAYPYDSPKVAGCAEMFVTGIQIPTENDPMHRLREHVKNPKNRNRGQRPRALLGRATTWALHKSLQKIGVKQVRRDMTGVSFFRRYYEEHFGDIIMANTPEKKRNDLPTAAKSKRIDDYEDAD